MNTVPHSPKDSARDFDTVIHPVELLQQLIRFNTTNPPGNERLCIEYLDTLLTSAGCETLRVALDEQRPNLISRIRGNGTAPPLLLYGHVDVVTTEQQEWTYPPFDGAIAEDCIWGRGALDMKGGIAMMVSAFLRLKRSGVLPAGDIVLAILSDEEAGGRFGAEYLVEHHAELFSDIRYAIGEFGGFSFHIGGRKFYPIQVAEKQSCRLHATVRGRGGHGSLAFRDGATARLGTMLQQLNTRRLPVHIIPVVREMLRTMSSALGFPAGLLIRALSIPLMTDRVLDLLGERGSVFDPLLHNTVNTTIIRGGDKINVIPAEIEVHVDVRLLPGQEPDHLLTEIREIIGNEIELKLSDFVPGAAYSDLTLFTQLAALLREADPQAIPIPYLLPAVTDARFFSRLNIQTYGFLPMPLPAELNFSRLIHSADERIPVAAVEFGTDVLEKLLHRYGSVR